MGSNLMHTCVHSKDGYNSLVDRSKDHHRRATTTAETMWKDLTRLYRKDVLPAGMSPTTSSPGKCNHDDLRPRSRPGKLTNASLAARRDERKKMNATHHAARGSEPKYTLSVRRVDNLILSYLRKGMGPSKKMPVVGAD